MCCCVVIACESRASRSGGVRENQGCAKIRLSSLGEILEHGAYPTLCHHDFHQIHLRLDDFDMDARHALERKGYRVSVRVMRMYPTTIPSQLCTPTEVHRSTTLDLLSMRRTRTYGRFGGLQRPSVTDHIEWWLALLAEAWALLRPPKSDI